MASGSGGTGASAVSGGAAANSANSAEEAQNTSKRPTDSAFKQQRLPAWQPILTANSVLPIFFVIGVAFIPVGIGMYWFSSQVREYQLNYTDCKNAAGQLCAEQINNTLIGDRNCTCEYTFPLNDTWEGQVYMYYGLENFYQNHRRYVKSRDDNQLLGTLSSDPSNDCHPFSQDKKTNQTYVPCGAIANSLFSDEITMEYLDDDNVTWKPVPLLRTEIAWQSDKHYKFKNPDKPDGTEARTKEELKEVLKDYAKPKDWKKELWELDPDNPDNNGLRNEDLIVWMRTAALPNFRKLYRRIDHSQEAFKGPILPNKTYKFTIQYNFEVKQFSGRKSVVLSTTSILGGKNEFLGIAYMVVGCICFVLGVLFLFVHVKYGKEQAEMIKVNSRTQFNE